MRNHEILLNVSNGEFINPYTHSVLTLKRSESVIKHLYLEKVYGAYVINLICYIPIDAQV